MSYGLTSGITVNIQTLNDDGTISKRSEGVSASRITKAKQATGLMGVKFSEYFTFRNFNYERPLTGVEDILDKDVIDVIDKRILQAQQPELFDIESLEAEILEINDLINVFRNSQKNTTDEEELERLSDELYCLTMLLEDKLSELNQLLIARGIKSANPLLIKLLSLDILGIVFDDIDIDSGSDGSTEQIIYVEWDLVDTELNTDVVDDVSWVFTITTNDGLPIEQEITPSLSNSPTGITNGVDYHIITIPENTFPIGSLSGSTLPYTIETLGTSTVGTVDLGFSADGATIVGSDSATITLSALGGGGGGDL